MRTVTITETLWQIVCGAESEGFDPRHAIRDYFAEKDCRITLAEVQVLVTRVKNLKLEVR